jgi:hypothetical protein
MIVDPVASDAPDEVHASVDARTSARSKAEPVEDVESVERSFGSRGARSKPVVAISEIVKRVKAARASRTAPKVDVRASRPWKGHVAIARPSAPSELAPFMRPPKGFLARVRAASAVTRVADHRDAVGFVREMGGGTFDVSRRAHMVAVVAIATLLAQGDPRRILVPFMSEPAVLQGMRALAEKSIVVAGKPPARWMDDETGEVAFHEDLLAVEGPLKTDAAGIRRAA